MATTVGTQATRIYPSSVAPREVVVRNDGASDATVSKDPLITVGKADGFVVKAGTEERVWLAEGEGLFAVVASGSVSIETI